MRTYLYCCIIFITISILYHHTTYTLTYPLPNTHNRLIGNNIEITIPENNQYSLEHFAAQYQVGLTNILAINPHVDIYLPHGNTKLIIPYQLILPDTPHTGIIINSAEMRLYFYPEKSNTVIVLPIAIGTIDNPTPSSWITSIKNKKKNPNWIPTKKMHKEYLQHGEILPKILLPGPTNPMGSYALYIGECYAIHGTNVNFGIGLRVTRGCIRLRPQDIKYLFNLIPIGTRVQFINEPVKITTESNGTQYLEVHSPLSYDKNHIYKFCPDINLLTYIKKYPCLSIINNGNHSNIDYKIVIQTLQKQSGIPINITRNHSNHNTNN